jgi:hypothetical protein
LQQRKEMHMAYVRLHIPTARRQRLAFAATLVAFTCALAACGGSDNAATPTTPTTPTTPETPATPTTPDTTVKPVMRCAP